MSKSKRRIAEEAIQLLEGGKEVLRKHKWIQGYLACSKEGDPVDVHEPEAHAFCALGALNRANKPNAHKALEKAIDTIDRVVAFDVLKLEQDDFDPHYHFKDGVHVVNYNDDRPGVKRGDVIRLFDKGIRRIQKELNNV
jgi:hypothetical protein